MNTMAKQRGVTAIGWLVILSLIAFFVFIGLKLFPIYAENFSVVSSLKSLKNDESITKKSSSEIKSIIMRRLQINGVYSITKKNITIEKRGGFLTVTCKYTVTAELAGPLSLVANFEEVVEVRGS